MEQRAAGSNWSVTVRDEYASKKHWHSEIEIAYVIEGTAIITIDEAVVELKKGETFVIHKGAVHYYNNPEGESKVCITKIPLEFCNGFSKKTRDYFISFYDKALYIANAAEIDSIFAAVQSIIGKQEEVSGEAALLEQFLKLTMFLTENSGLIKERVGSKANNDSEVMERMIQYVEEHLNEKLTLTHVADYLGFSESYCSKYFKKKTNMNFLEYLNHTRILRAEEELRSSDTSVTEIAYMTGFTSTQSFNRVFKNLCNVSPSEYRKRLHDKKQDILDKK